jgi:hypothetical protein
VGWPSSHEHDQEKRDDAVFTEHKMASDLQRLLIAPVAKRKPSKKQKSSAGAPDGTLSMVERLERTVRQQTAQIADLEGELEQARQALGAERAHVRQLKERDNKSSDLLQQSALRKLKNDHEAELSKLKDELQARNQELSDFRRLQALFTK